MCYFFVQDDFQYVGGVGIVVGMQFDDYVWGYIQFVCFEYVWYQCYLCQVVMCGFFVYFLQVVVCVEVVVGMVQGLQVIMQQYEMM